MIFIFIAFLISCLPLFSIQSCFYSFNQTSFPKFSLDFFFSRSRVNLVIWGLWGFWISNSKVVNLNPLSKLKHIPFIFSPSKVSSSTFKIASIRHWFENHKCAISRYSLLSLSFTLYLGLVFIRIDRFSFFFGVIIWGLLVVLWPCRAKGHVEPDHPFSTCFCVFLNVLVVDWSD